MPLISLEMLRSGSRNSDISGRSAVIRPNAREAARTLRMEVGLGDCTLMVIVDQGLPPLARMRKAVRRECRRPAGLLAVKQENPPNGGRIPF